MARRLLFRWLFLPGLHFGGVGILAGLVELNGGRRGRQVLTWELAALRDLLDSMAVSARTGADPSMATEAWLHRWWTWSGAQAINPTLPAPRPGVPELSLHMPSWAVPAAEIFFVSVLMLPVIYVLTRPPVRRAFARATGRGLQSAGGLARQTVRAVTGRPPPSDLEEGAIGGPGHR